jgi:O-antigen/teichoic acid export membrane protein
VASTASSMLAAPQAAVVTTLIPVASGLSATESPERLGQIVIKTTRYANAVLCLITLPLLFALYPFLRLWVGLDYARHALPLGIILIVAQFIRLTLMPYAAIGFGTGQQQRMLISPLGEGVFNLICSVAGAWLWGALGVALGTLAGVFVGVFLHFVNSMPRTDTMVFSRRGLAISGIGRPFACCLPSLFVLLAFHGMGSILAQMSLVAAAELAAAAILWMANFDAGERRQLLNLFHQAIRARTLSTGSDLNHAN